MPPLASVAIAAPDKGAEGPPEGEGPSPPPGRTRAGSVETRTRIGRAALALFVQRGIDGATTREIAAVAGLSEGALYRHFPSKEAIAEALYAEISARLARATSLAGDAGEGIGEQAGAVVDAWTRCADHDWPLFAYRLRETARFEPTPPGRDDPARSLEAIVEAAMDRGEIPRNAPALIAAMALGVIVEPARAKAEGRLSGPLAAQAPAMKIAIRAVLSLR